MAETKEYSPGELAFGCIGMMVLASVLALTFCSGGTDSPVSSSRSTGAAAPASGDDFIALADAVEELSRGPTPATPRSISRPMRFEDCTRFIGLVGQSLGRAPTNIVETDAMRMVRFGASDGSMLITCSRPDGSVVVTRSPHTG